MSAVARKVVGWWLLLGCFMLGVQVILGGITRLTESGLSITEWKPVRGTIPPLNEIEWNTEFERYKQKIQYKIINEGMTLSEFKWIYFWEYFHRLWGRLILVAFLIPFIYFLLKKYIGKELIPGLMGLFIFGGLQGFVGWIMVYGGLTGLYVPPLRLTAHLIMAFILMGWLFWVALDVLRGNSTWSIHPSSVIRLPSLQKLAIAILVLLSVQVFLGGITSGMKAGLAYPTWPDMNGQLIPSALFSEQPTFAGWLTYNPQDYWGRTFIQFAHRFTAYTLVVLVLVFFFKSRNITNDRLFKAALNFFPVIILLQALLGIITVINCVGKIPVSWGMLHQAGAMVLMMTTVFILFHLKHSKSEPATKAQRH